MRWLALALLLALYAVLSLEPFDWRIPPRLENGVQRLGAQAGRHPAEGGWRFAAAGIVVAQAPLEGMEAAIKAETLTVSLEVRPYLADQSGPARILTISPDAYARNLTVGQQHADLVVRLRTQVHDGPPVARIADVFEAGRWVAIDLRIEPGRLLVTIDGRPALETPLPPVVLGTWDPSFDLALGNETTCNRPWLGEIRAAVVSSPDGTADYARTGVVEVPDSCLVSRHPPKLVPFRDFLLDDVLRNTLMYVPLGCLLGLMARTRRARTFGTLIVVIAGVSLAFEVTQLFLESRFPSVDDLIFNTLGGASGLALVFWLAGRAESAWRSRP